MLNTVRQYLSAITNGIDRLAIRQVVEPMADRFSSVMLSTAGLVIKAGGSAVVKTGAAACYALVDGKLVTKGAATDMAALSGTVTNAKFNVFAFFMDAAGTVTSAMGIEAATLAAVTFPPIPEKSVVIGFVVINPTGTGNFVGGTTVLDDVTVVPNAAYVSPVGAFQPSILLG